MILLVFTIIANRQRKMHPNSSIVVQPKRSFSQFSQCGGLFLRGFEKVSGWLRREVPQQPSEVPRGIITNTRQDSWMKH